LNLRGGATEERIKSFPKKAAGSIEEPQNKEGIYKATSAGVLNLGHVAQTWKRRARAGQRRSEPFQTSAMNGKRKNGEVHVTSNARQNGVRRPRLNPMRGMVLRDEEEETYDGSGMAGSESQPRRPA
jgi:hypothetical protein